MKITNINVVSRLKALEDMKKRNTINLPIRLSYAVQRNKDKLIEEYGTYQKELVKIFERYDLKEAPDGKIEGVNKLSEEQLNSFNGELNELLSIEVDINIMTVSVSGLPETLFISSADMDALSFMLED